MMFTRNVLGYCQHKRTGLNIQRYDRLPASPEVSTAQSQNPNSEIIGAQDLYANDANTDYNTVRKQRGHSTDI